MRASPRPVSLAFGGLVAMAAAMGLGRFVYTPILPFMVGALNLSKGEAGLIASANFAGYLAGALLAATPYLPGSRRAWLLGGLAASGLSTAATGLVSAMAGFLVLRFLGGLASAFVLVYASTLVLERLHAARRGGLTALHFGGVGVGIAVSAVLVSGLAALDIGWRGHWIAAGLVSLAAVAAAAALIPNRAEPKLAPGQRGSGTAGLAALIAAYGLFGFGYIITATFLVAIVRAAPQIAPLEPAIWLVVGLAGVPSVALWSWVGARIGLLRAFALACLVEALGVAASVVWIAPAGVVLAAVLLGGTFIGITALGLAGARQIATRASSASDPRRVLALMTAAFGLGQIVGPIFAGHLHDVSGSFLGASLSAAAALLIAAALAFGTAARAA